MELPIGVEPMNRGFAIRRLTILAKEAKMGAGVGFEPTISKL